MHYDFPAKREARVTRPRGRLLGEEILGAAPAHIHPEVGRASSARPPRGYLYKQHFERIRAIHPEHLQLRLVVATAALHLSSSGQGDVGLFRDQLGTHTPRTPSAHPASAGAVKGSAFKLGVARLSAPLRARSQVPEHAVRCLLCVQTRPLGKQRKGDYFQSRQGEQKALQAGTPMQHSGEACRGTEGEGGRPRSSWGLEGGCPSPLEP